MIGTLLNTAAILAGGALGVLLDDRLSDRLKQTVVTGLGLFTLAYGVVSFTRSNNVLVVLGAILLGGILGEWWKIEEGLRWLSHRLDARFNRAGDENDEKRFVRGFLAATLMFCVGPLAILGSIQDGLTGDYSLLAIKAVLDLFGSLAFASTLGVGVLFSAPVLLLYQGSLTLLAAQVQTVVSAEMMAEMTAAGGVILLGLAISSLLELRPVRSASFLPALVLAPLLVIVFKYFGIY